jgi:transcription initiation factor TFIIB
MMPFSTRYATTFLFHTTHVFVNSMVMLSSNGIFMNKLKDDNVNSISETSTVCPLCKGDNAIITDPKSGEIICSKCGMVILDKSLEQRTHWQRNATEGIVRTGLARHDMGLSTVIGKENIDSSKNKINPSMLPTLHRLRTWDFRTQLNNSSDRSLKAAFSELDSLKDKLGLSDAIIERTAYIYRKAQEKGMLRGRSISTVLGATIFIACMELEVPRTLDDIATISNVKRKSIAKYHRKIVFELQIKVPAIDSTKCIGRIANKANISEKTKHQAINLMDDAVKHGVSAGKDPMGLAAAVLFASCAKTGEQKSKVDLANAGQTTDATIRKRVKELKSRLELNK